MYLHSTHTDDRKYDKGNGKRRRIVNDILQYLNKVKKKWRKITLYWNVIIIMGANARQSHYREKLKRQRLYNTENPIDRTLKHKF